MSIPPISPPPLDTIVYSRSGQRAKYICSVAGRYGTEHFVKPEVEFGTPDGDVDSSFEGAAIWHEFFLSPPREVIDKEIVALEAKAEGLRAEVQRLAREKTEAEKDVAARKARLAQHAQLKQLDDFITKGVSCYAIDHDYGRIDIVDLKDTKSDTGWSSRGEFRLLSLYGKSEGRLDWHLHQYSDGSGSSKHICIPCANREDAAAAVAELLNRRWTEWREKGCTAWIAEYAKSAVKHGIRVPDDILDYLSEQEKKNKQAALQAAEKQFVAAQEKLMKAREGLVDLSGTSPFPGGPVKPAK